MAGLQSNPLRKDALLQRLVRNIMSSSFSGVRSRGTPYAGRYFREQRLFSSGTGSVTSSNSVAAPKSRSDSADAKSTSSFNIKHVLASLMTIPAFMAGFVKREQKTVEKIEDAINEAAETVAEVAEEVEQAAVVIEKVAENTAKDARETRELMDKIEAAADAIAKSSPKEAEPKEVP